MKLFTRNKLDRAHAERLAALMKVLAAPARLQILALPDLSVLNVTQIAGAVGLAQPTVTHHMHVLVAAGFVTPEWHGRDLLHTLNPGGLAAVADALRGAR